MAQTPFEKALVDEGIVGTPLESLARSIYMQESSGGKNTKTSNAGAVGGMQILPGTFNEVLPGGNINDPYDNSRAGLRYIKKMNDLAGGDLTLTAAGYYGGPGGLNKAKEGVAVSDPRNPNAPTTLQYAKQVTARQNKSVPRETSPAESPAIKENIADLGQNYQAAYALMAMADEEPETTREIEAREAAEEQSAAQQFANMQKQLASIKPASPFADQGSQEPQNFKDGGEVEEEDEDDKSEARKAFDKYLKKATRERSALDVEFKTPPPQPMVVEGLGVQRGAPPSIEGRVGYDQDGFRMGASGVAVKTPQGVKYMPGMYDVGYKTPMAGGELDFNYARGMKTMPGMPTPQMANVRYVRKFEEGGDVAPVYDKKVSPEKKLANLLGLGPAYEASVQAPKDMGLSGDEGTEGDAVRHMVLMREVSKKYGPVGAKVLGYAHEFGPNMLSGQSSKDREMDLNNNALGLELAKQAGGDEELFKRLVAQALGDKKATYYRDEYNNSKFPVEQGNMVSAKNMLKAMPKGEGVRKRAGGSPEEGETKSPEKSTLKEIVRSTQYLPYDLIGAPIDVINMGLKGIDYVTGSKLATEKPFGSSDYLIDKSNKLGIADKPTGSMTETLTRVGTGLITPGGVVKAVQIAARPVGAAKKMLDEVKIGKMAKDEIDPAIVKEIMEAKTGPRPVVRDNRLLPTSEQPYVGELERIVSDLPGATTVQQIKGMVANTGRNYEIERLENALQGLGPKDKISSADLLKRLDETSSPMGYRVQILEPEPKYPGKYYQGDDNPRPSQPLGVINLMQEVPPAKQLEGRYYENMFSNLNAIKSEIKKPEERANALKELELYFRGPDAAGTPLGETFKQAAPEIKKYADEILEATNFNDRYKYINYGQKIPGVPTLVEASYEIAAKKYGKPYHELANYETQLIKPEAEALIKQRVLEAADKRYGLDLQNKFQDPTFTSLEPKARQEAMESAFTNQMRSQALNSNAQFQSLIEPYGNLVKQKFVENQGYKGQHSSLLKDKTGVSSPVAFSRFLDVDLPGDKKGMFVTELQSDRYDDLVTKGAKSGSGAKDTKEISNLHDVLSSRKSQIDELQYLVDKGEDVAKNEMKLKQAQIEQVRDEKRMSNLGGRIRGRGTYSVEEAFPGMESNPQVLQQLMIKNAVVGGIQRGKDAVLFPGADSKQKQLYEKLPNNIKAVLKDLGPGFKMETIPMTSENGDIINRISITWDKKAAERLQKQGVRFAKGGLVEKKY